GPRGRIGPVGPFIKRSAAAHSETRQVFAPLSGNAIDFEINNYTPIGIVHPTLNGTTEFAVLNAGFYFITFTFSVDIDPSISTMTVFAHLMNLTTGLPIPPNPFAAQKGTLIEDISFTQPGNFSGQTIVFLPAGTRIQLQLSKTTTVPMAVLDATF